MAVGDAYFASPKTSEMIARVVLDNSLQSENSQ